MLKYLKKYWYIAVIAAVFMVIEVSVDLYQPRLMEAIVDDGILGLNNGGVSDINLVVSTGIRMVLIVFCGGLAGVLCGVFSNISAQNYGNALRKDLFGRIMHFSFEQTDDFSTGSLITRVTSDVTQVQNMVMQFTRGLVRCLMFSIGGTCALISLNISFSRVILIALPLIFIEIVLIVRKTNPQFTLLQNRLDHMNTVIQENVDGMRVVKAFVQEKREKARFEKANDELVQTQLRVLKLLAFMQPFANIVLNLSIVAVIMIGGIEVQSGTMAPGVIMAAVTYLSQILNGMLMLAMIFQTLSRGFASSKRLREILNTYPVIVDGGVSEGTERGTVSFEHVSFTYPGAKEPVLRDISLCVHEGETIGIIGPTGSGKSTLVDMIPRFYDTTEGTVRVDGIPVREWNLDALRKRIAFVLQTSELFSTTIRENIMLSNPEATEAELFAAAGAAQADDFISRQPQQYDTPVAEAGHSLSGGQKQRIAIARALLKNSEILIFDDSTSALDLKTEAALHAAVHKNYGNLTRIIIAQRVASIQNADKIAVIEDGRITAFGSHEDLLKTSPLYLEICNSQLRKGGDAE